MSAELGAQDGAYDGKLTNVPPTGEARYQALADYAKEHELDLKESVAYADSTSDLPMLEAVGFPVAVNAETKLAAIARRRGWLIEHWTKSDGAPNRTIPIGPRTLRGPCASSELPPCSGAPPAEPLEFPWHLTPKPFTSTGLRPQRRQTDTAAAVPPRRQLPARKAPGRSHPGDLPSRAAPGPARPRSGDSSPLLEPIDDDPLPELLKPGMKLTIAFDDISLPLPSMRKPDIRQRIIEQVLDMAAAAGVDDVHLIAALALHRRMTEDELRHALGDRVYDAFAPQGALYNHDAEDPDGMVELGRTRHDEAVTMNKRAAESDLLIYVNLNIVSMDGGWKSTATGLSGYSGIKHHHNVKTMRESKSFMDRHNSELHHSNWRQGEVIKNHGPRIFQIETTINNNTFGYDGALSLLQKREWEWTAKDRITFMGMKKGLDLMPASQRRQIFNGWKAPYELTSVQAATSNRCTRSPWSTASSSTSCPSKAKPTFWRSACLTSAPTTSTR